MKKYAATLALLAVLAACGPGKLRVHLKGGKPYTSASRRADGKIVDERRIVFSCPSCGTEVAGSAKTCTKGECGAELAAEESYPCPNCEGTKMCHACRMYGSRTGACHACRGSGWTPGNVECRNCNVAGGKPGKCPICKGELVEGVPKCDFCGGKGKMTPDELAAFDKPRAPADSPEGAPPAPTPAAAETPPAPEPTPAAPAPAAPAPANP